MIDAVEFYTISCSFSLLFPFISLFILFACHFCQCKSDGGGRSGVYTAIDANMELAEEEDCFHVFGFLKKLRQSRKGLIENVVSIVEIISIELEFSIVVTGIVH